MFQQADLPSIRVVSGSEVSVDRDKCTEVVEDRLAMAKLRSNPSACPGLVCKPQTSDSARWMFWSLWLGLRLVRADPASLFEQVLKRLPKRIAIST